MLDALDHMSRVECVTQPVPNEIDRHDREEDRESWEYRGPRRVGHVLRRVLEHVPPRGHRWLDAESEEREGALRDDRPRNPERRGHDDRRERVRQDVANDQIAGPGADRWSRRNELT